MTASEESVKKYFSMLLEGLRNVQKNYAPNLPNLKTDNFELWRRAALERPEEALKYITYEHFIEIFELLEHLFDSKQALYAEILNLNETVQKIADKTGVDLSEMKTQVAEIKEAMEAPIYKYVKTQEATEEQKNKLEAEILDWAIRSR